MNSIVTNWLDEHLKAHGVKYLWTMIFVFVTGALANGWAIKWLDGRIISRATAQIIEQTEPIQQKVDKIEKDVQDVKVGLKELLERSVAKEILDITSLLCSSPGNARLIDQLEDAQAKYEMLHGNRYVAPSCEVLRRANQ